MSYEPLTFETSQELFDKCARHLLTQMERSVTGDGRCRYRGPGGLMCAVGPFLSDEAERLEGWCAVPVGDESVRAPARFLAFENRGLIGELQRVHDNHLPEEWKMQLRFLASDESLSEAVLEEFA